MTLAQFRELRRLRVLIEGFAAAEAAVTITPRQLEASCVHEHAFRRESAGTLPNPARAMQKNCQLHFALYAATGMPPLPAVIEGLWRRAGPVLNLDMRVEPRRLKRGTAVRCHAALVQALRRRYPEAAREAVVADISAAAQHIAELGKLAVDTVGADSKGTDDGSGDRGPARAGRRRR
jgi:DNA-binding GntR family transcriptional regulator